MLSSVLVSYIGDKYLYAESLLGSALGITCEESEESRLGQGEAADSVGSSGTRKPFRVVSFDPLFSHWVRWLCLTDGNSWRATHLRATSCQYSKPLGK